MPSSRPGSRRADHERAKPSTGVSRRRWGQYFLVFVTVLLIVNALIGERGLLEAWRMRDEHAALDASIAGLRRENARLTDAVRRYRHDPQTIEEAARRYLGLMRPGELLFIVKDVPAGRASAAQAQAPAEPAPPPAAPAPAR
jgi:cell division protein FtsB